MAGYAFAKPAYILYEIRSRGAKRASLGSRNVKQRRIFFVTTGLDPVVHAEVRYESLAEASPPHGLPDQVRQ